MQILAIRGSNLASLAQGFEIDLTAEPLRSSGLFAITGDTGAGKSTILDALCLALYGECPRLGGTTGVNDTVPDVAGETIKSSDARSILRRGAASGHAEVDFIGMDGQVYRARWATRRARDRAVGKLQNVDRSLIRVSDGAVLDSQTNAVKARVTEITGLTYDEFRRTVLLAQGDFDAFLRANTQDRAALLEKVTGTGIYRAISKRVYERAGGASQALAVLEAQRAAKAALSDEARATLADEAAALTARVQGLATEILDLSAGIAAHEAVRAALTQWQQATAAREAAETAVAEAEADRAQLTRIETALALRPEQARCTVAESRLQALAQQEQAERQALEAAQVTEAAAAERHRAAVEAHEAAEELFRILGPDWSQAERLDESIGSAGREQETAETALRAAEDQLAEAQAEVTRCVAQRSEARETHDAAAQDMATAPHTGALAERWDEIDRRLTDRGAETEALATAAAAAEAAAAEATAYETALAELAEADRADRDSIAGFEQTARDARVRLEQIGAQDPQADLARLVDGIAAVQDMAGAATTWGRAHADATQAAGSLAAQQTEHRAGQAAMAAAQQALAQAQLEVAALERPADLAAAAASAEAAHLRMQLVEGDPCPVCGAVSHPVLQDTALAEAAAALRRDLDEARSAVRTHSAQQDAAERQRDRAELAIAQAQTAAHRAAEDQAQAVDRFDRARAGAEATGLSGLPLDPATAPEPLGALLRHLADQRREIDARIRDQAELRQTLDADAGKMATLRQGIEDRETRRRGLSAQRDTARNTQAIEAHTAAHARASLERIDAELAPVLKTVGYTPSDLDTPTTRDALAAKVTWWRAQDQARATAEQRLTALAPEIASAETKQSAAQATVTRCAADVAERRAALERFTADRRALLGGDMDTAAHRTRHNAQRKACQSEKDTAAAALAEAGRAQAGIDARLTQVLQDQGPAQAEQDAARAELALRLDEAGMTGADLAALLAEGVATAARLRADLKRRDDALTGAVSTQAARAQDLATTQDAGVPETDEAALRTARSERESMRDTAQTRLGAIAAEIDADDRARADLADLAAAIAEAKAHNDTWAAVNAAIGSASGAKFAQAAQAVTLSLLVERANLHLKDLKPRYRLAQGNDDDLALHVVDRDMGDERRSTRSLSGGERFLISLALALALSQMGAHGALAATLFIDEGFGALDAESLDIAMDALETLQAQGRTIGVISHVEAMKDRIPTQIRIIRRGSGASTVEIAGMV